MTEAERKARLKWINKETARVLADPFYRKHPTLRKSVLAQLADRHKELSMPPRRNGIFGADAVKKAKRVTKTPPQVVESHTGERGEIVAVMPGGWLKVKWRNRQRPTLIKRSELKRANLRTRRNPTSFYGVSEYIQRLRNKEKKRYAVAYWQWLLNGKAGPEPERGALTAMGAQSVRVDLAGLVRAAEDKLTTDRRNPGLVELVGGLQAADYLLGKVAAARKNPSHGGAGAGATSSDVRSPTRTSTEVRSPTKTSTVADTRGNITVTGGAGAGATTKVIVRRNPTPREMSDRFQGKSTGAVRQYYASNRAPRLDYSRAGRLTHLKVNGKSIPVANAVVVIDPIEERLWIAGVKERPLFNRKAKHANEVLDYGEVDAIGYLTAKKHIGGGKTFDYRHPFGEEGGKKPRLYIDHEGMPILHGGDYKLEDRGIVN